MIKRPGNWDDVKAPSSYVKIEPGAYVCRILGARQETRKNHQGVMRDCLVIDFDITEGAFTGYYKEKYERDSQYRKSVKWSGTLSNTLPLDDGSEDDEKIKSALKGTVTAIEESNSGFKWDWDEKSLVGRTVGVVLRDKEYDFEGKHGMAAMPFRFCDANKARSGEVEIPEPKMLNRDATPAIPPMPTEQTSYVPDAYAAPAPTFTGGFVEMQGDDGLPF